MQAFLCGEHATTKDTKQEVSRPTLCEAKISKILHVTRTETVATPASWNCNKIMVTYASSTDRYASFDLLGLAFNDMIISA